MAPPNPCDANGFEDFRRLAQDVSLSPYERIGFPDSYRQGFEPAIFQDIRRKLTNLEKQGARILDIGPGSSDLPRLLLRSCEEKGQKLTLIDSAEMLEHLPDKPFLEKVPSRFPDCTEWIQRHQGKLDAWLCYSVLHYVFVEIPLFHFLDAALSLLAPGGQGLIGDIPNISKRKRFFASEAGVRFHREFMKTSEKPQVDFNQVEKDKIDDSVVFAVLQRARQAGFDAYVLPQDPSLPMANRREDILIVRP